MHAVRQPVSDLTESDLRAMRFKDLMALFGKLPAPSLQEMDGEFAARLLAQPNAVAQVIGHLTVNNPLMPGRWLCKAFKPVSADRGQGYNSFAHLGRTVRRYPMQTLIAPSRYDGRPAYTLVYAAFSSMCGAIHMVDEVRQVGDETVRDIETGRGDPGQCGAQGEPGPEGKADAGPPVVDPHGHCGARSCTRDLM